MQQSLLGKLVIFHNTKNMKNKLLLLNIISYVVVYHLVYESVFCFFIDKKGIEVTPIGFLISNYSRSNPNMWYFLLVIVVFIINTSVCGILFHYIYKWYDKLSLSKLFFRLLLVFSITSFLVFFILIVFGILTSSITLLGLVILLYLPMPIMAMSIPFLFKFNKWILGDKD